MDSDVHLREAINEWALFLARGVYSVISMFDPEAVLIGGGLSEQEKVYQLLDRHLETFEMWEALRVPIHPCKLGNQAGRLGGGVAGEAEDRAPVNRARQSYACGLAGNSRASRSR
ncbi:fructokinase [Pseudescherichia vulneris]|nr:fructokinase [Pseudescherichia vulneris]